MKRFFRGLKSLNVFACHCWIVGDRLKVGIFIIQTASSKGTICTLKDCDSDSQVLIQIPKKLDPVTLNTELLIIPRT